MRLPAISAAAPDIGRSSMRRCRPAPSEPDRSFAAASEASCGSPRRGSTIGEDVFVGDATRFFAAPASEASLAALYAAHPDAVLARRRHRCRPLGHQEHGRRSTRSSGSAGSRVCDAIEDTPEALVIGAMASHADAYRGPCGDRSRSRRDHAPLRLGAGARIRHRRRQHRQRLAHRRSRARADRTRLRSSNCADASDTRTHSARNVSSSPIANRTGCRANTCGASSCRSSRPTRAFRAYKVTKRFDEDISACARARSGSRSTGRTHRVRAHRLRRHGGHSETRARKPRPRSSAFPSTMPAAWGEALSALGARLPAPRRPPRVCRLSRDGRAQPALQGVERNRIRRNPRDADRRSSRCVAGGGVARWATMSKQGVTSP